MGINHLASERLPVGQRAFDFLEDDAGPRGPELAEQKESLSSRCRALGAKRGLAPVPGAPHDLDHQAALWGQALKRHGLEPGT